MQKLYHQYLVKCAKTCSAIGQFEEVSYTTQTASPRSSVSDTTKTTTGTSQTEESSTATGPSAGDLLAAELINASLNWNYNPCDDFYRFVCSRFEGGIDALYKVAIHKEDEEWMQYNFLAYGNVWRLKAFYEAKLLLYDSNLDTSTLGDRIIRAENIAQWERLITGHTNHTFRPKDSIQLLDNATTVLALLTVDSILARDDSRLLVAWSLLHRLLPLAHGQEMRRTKSASPNKGASIEEFCYEKVAGVMGLAVSKKYFNSVIPPATMDAAARLAMDVMRALVQKLNTTFWIRDPVRSLVLSKAEIMGLVVGFPVEYSDQSALDAAF
ncbi:hypothetical protein V5799_030186, partial [Amblyomma americanum]